MIEWEVIIQPGGIKLKGILCLAVSYGGVLKIQGCSGQ